MTIKLDDKPEFKVDEVARIVGVTPSALRAWEMRFGWPTPPRQDNGYRMYPRPMVEQIAQVAEMHREGVPLGELIHDGQPDLAAGTAAVNLRKLVTRLRASLGLARECLLCPPERWWTAEERARREAAVAAGGGEAEYRRLVELRLSAADRRRLEQTAADLRAALELARAAAPPPVARPAAEVPLLRQRLDEMTRAHRMATEIRIPQLVRQVRDLQDQLQRARRGR